MVETFSGEEQIDFSDPAFYKVIFTEYLEKEPSNVFDNTQWLTCVSLFAQLLYSQIKNGDGDFKIYEKNTEIIKSFIDGSLKDDFKKGRVSNDVIEENKGLIREIIDIL